MCLNQSNHDIISIIKIVICTFDLHILNMIRYLFNLVEKEQRNKCQIEISGTSIKMSQTNLFRYVYVQ